MLTRRTTLLAALAGIAPLPRFAHAGASTPQTIIAAARARGARPYIPSKRMLSPPFDNLDYDSYRTVRPRFGRAASLHVGAHFRADLLPPGWLFTDPVQVSLPGHATDFSPDLFHYDTALASSSDASPDMARMGFSGVRFQTRLNTPDRWDEVLVLQGASYFRALAKNTVHGLSARALSLGTGGAAPEEFPVTQEISVFDAGESLHFGCLIDSPRAAAALIATLTPGTTTRMRCALHLFPREVLADAGIAPLTSMFQHNDAGPARIDDFRPAVHDSDVLVIDNGAGERLWRPLANPATLQMSAFLDDSPRGFGLIQIPTEFDSFRDAEGAYHRRPSAWVRPLGDWGRGAVMLLEIPTEDEFADNIVAFWRPSHTLAPGEHRFDYDLDWMGPGTDALPTRSYPLTQAQFASGVEPNAREGRLFVLDFVGEPDTIPESEALRVDIGPVSGVAISGVTVYPLQAVPGKLRVSFVLTPEADTDSAELRLSLRDQTGAPMSPVWLYRWTRAAGGGV